MEAVVGDDEVHLVSTREVYQIKICYTPATNLDLVSFSGGDQMYLDTREGQKSTRVDVRYRVHKLVVWVANTKETPEVITRWLAGGSLHFVVIRVLNDIRGPHGEPTAGFSQQGQRNGFILTY